MIVVWHDYSEWWGEAVWRFMGCQCGVCMWYNQTTCIVPVFVATVLDVIPDGVITPADVVYVVNQLGEPDGIADVDGVDGVTQADVNAVIAALGTDLRNLDD